MAKGLINAVDKAADYCATAHDLGEIKHMLAWKAISQLLFNLEDLDLSNQVTERCKACLTFELQFESRVEVYDYTNSMAFSVEMKSTINPLYPNVQGQAMAWIAMNDSPRGFGPLIYTPKLNYPSKPGRDVAISRINTEPASALLPEVKILDPIRYVPINPNKSRLPETKPQETPPSDEDENEDGDEKKDKKDDKIMLIFDRLEATEFIELTCSDLWGGMDDEGAFGPYTFNNLHEDDWNYTYEGFEFELECGYGELFGWATSEKNALDIAKEKTTFQLIHKAPRVR